LSDAEAQDVVQDTVLSVAKKIGEFKCDPAAGSFKAWLLLITRRRIEKQLKKRIPMRAGRAAQRSEVGVTSGVAGPAAGSRSDETERTATGERLPDPKGFDLESVWDAEWKQNLWTTAVSRVKARVKPKQYQMFDLFALKEWPVKEVARALA
jgi:RNA polymerase sigma-70 factor (ECF subfamily)